MKGSESFKSVIEKYLTEKAANDELFAASFKKENKNIDECINYILNEVQKLGCNGFADEEVFGMAIHYYDEDNIEVNEAIPNGRVVVNHAIEITDDDVKKAKDEAYQKLVNEQVEAMKASKATKKVNPQSPDTPSLFDI